MTTSGKAQGAYVVTDAELQSNGGAFRVQPGPALRVSAIDAGTRGVTGGASLPVYVVDDAYVAAHGAIGGKPIPVSDLTAVARAVDHPLIAMPVYVVDGVLGATPVVPAQDVYIYLKAWWSLNEAAGDIRVDSHGDFDLTPVNSPLQVTAVVGNGAGSRVTGTRYLQSADNGLATLGQDFCIAGWMRTVGVTQFPLISRRGGNTVALLDWEIFFSDLNAPACGILVRDRALNANGVTQLGITANAWFFFAGWLKALSPIQTELALRVNNNLVTSVVATPGIATANPKVMVGRRDSGTPGQANGDYDEIVYWIDYVPSTTELDWLYNGGNGRTYAQFVAQYG